MKEIEMLFFNSNVISKKIQHNNSLLKSKSFAASFGVHAALFTSVAFFMTTHPIPLPKAEERIVISLAEFTSASGDIHTLEQLPQPKKIVQPISKVQPKTVRKIAPIPITTPERIATKQPTHSSEASAPLVQHLASASTPPTSRFNDSPHLTDNTSEKELPRNPVSDKQLGGAALGHIRAMIENAITYPSIARKLRLEGVVLVTFILKSDGTVETAHVQSTSGSNLLDNKALQTILSLSGDYPALGKTFELSIPIAFNLHKS
jgi:protein TonB